MWRLKVESEGLEVLSGLISLDVPTLLEPRWPSPFLSERLPQISTLHFEEHGRPNYCAVNSIKYLLLRDIFGGRSYEDENIRNIIHLLPGWIGDSLPVSVSTMFRVSISLLTSIVVIHSFMSCTFYRLYCVSLLSDKFCYAFKAIMNPRSGKYVLSPRQLFGAFRHSHRSVSVLDGLSYLSL